jgi:hypothetical protein
MAEVTAWFSSEQAAAAAVQALNEAGIGDPAAESQPVAGEALATGISAATLLALPLIGPALAMGPLADASQRTLKNLQARLPGAIDPAHTQAAGGGFMVVVRTTRPRQAKALLTAHGGQLLSPS